MAKFAGTWKFVSVQNAEKMLEVAGVSPEARKKLAENIRSATTEFVWDAKTGTLTRINKLMDFKSEIKMNATVQAGVLAPGFSAVISELKDDLVRSKIKSPNGEEVGTSESRVEGNNIHTTTTLKGETGSIKLEKVQ